MKCRFVATLTGSALTLLLAGGQAPTPTAGAALPKRDAAVGVWVSDTGPLRAILVVNPNETYYYLKYIPGEMHSRIKEFGVCRINGPMLAMRAKRIKLEWPVNYSEDPASAKGPEPSHSETLPLRKKHLFAHFHASSNNRTATLDALEFVHKTP